MKLIKILPAYLAMLCTFGLLITSCQKMERPALGDYPEDPPAPPLQILGAQSYWAFDGVVNDTGAFNLQAKRNKIAFVSGVTFVDGVTGGEALSIGDKGYLMIQDIPDALKNPGSISVAFWFKGTGPVKGGAQGLFAISNTNRFWGNLEIFLENFDTNSDSARIKIRLVNKDAGAWIDVRVPDVLNQWSHLAFVYDGATSTASLYINGESVYNNAFDAATWGSLMFEDVGGVAIGTFAFQTAPSLTNHGPEGWAKSFNGALDQFRIFTDALSASEVQNLVDNKL